MLIGAGELAKWCTQVDKIYSSPAEHRIKYTSHKDFLALQASSKYRTYKVHNTRSRTFYRHLLLEVPESNVKDSQAPQVQGTFLLWI